MKLLLRKEIGLRLRKIRKALGYTQAEMVSCFDIGRANYSRIEKGEIFPSPTVLNILCTKFNVSLDWLIANEGHMFILEKEKQDALKTLKSGKYGQEVNDLLFHLEKVPMVRHAMMGFFLEYKQKNQEIIQEILGKIIPLPSNDRANSNNE